MNYRKATLQDIPDLVHIRKKQLIDEGIQPLINMDEELTAYFHDKLSDETMIEWVIEEEDRIIATAAIIFYEFPPCFTNRTGKKAYIANVYTAPEYRRKGLATSLLDRVIQEAEKRRVEHLWLEASVHGRPVYEKYGFCQSHKWMEYEL